MLADQFTACNQASLSPLLLDLPQKATAADRLNGREFVKKKRGEEKGDEEKKWPSRNVDIIWVGGSGLELDLEINFAAGHLIIMF